MKEIKINVDNYNENSIKTIEGDNLSEVYKIYICKNKRRIDLTNKIAIMAYVNECGSKKSNILALNITNAAEGEIELPITNAISSENGVYACQIAILGENNSLEQTAPFNLIVEDSMFSKISNTAINSTDFQILSEAIKTTSEYAEKLKEGTENIELKYADKLKSLGGQITEIQEDLKNKTDIDDNTTAIDKVWSSSKTKQMIELIPKGEPGEKGEPGSASLAIDDSQINTSQTWSSSKIDMFSNVKLYGKTNLEWETTYDGILVNLGDSSTWYIYGGTFAKYETITLAGTYKVGNYRILAYNKSSQSLEIVANIKDNNYIPLLYNVDNVPSGALAEKLKSTVPENYNAIFTSFNSISKSGNTYSLPLGGHIYIYKSNGGYIDKTISEKETSFTLNNYEGIYYDFKKDTIEKKNNDSKDGYLLLDCNENGFLGKLVQGGESYKQNFEYNIMRYLEIPSIDKPCSITLTNDCQLYLFDKPLDLKKGTYDVGEGNALIYDLSDNTVKQIRYNNQPDKFKDNIILAVRGWSPYLYQGFLVDLINQKRLLNANKNSDEVPSYWKEELDKFYNELAESEREGFPRETFKVPFVTDMHIEYSFKKSMQLLAYLDKKMGFRFILNGGDTMSLFNPEHCEEYLEWLSNNRLNNKMLYTIGNHEYMQGSSRIVYNKLFSPLSASNPYIKFPSDYEDLGTYYYADDDVNNVRYICLDTNTTVKSVKQQEWLAKTLFDMKDKKGWSVIFFGHHSPKIEDFPFSGEGATDDYMPIMGAFKKKTTCRVNEHDYDYSDNVVDVIGLFSGHVHYDAMGESNGLTVVGILNDSNLDETYKGVATPKKVNGTTTECAFDIIVVNKKEKKVTLKRIGAGLKKEREFSYK